MCGGADAPWRWRREGGIVWKESGLGGIVWKEVASEDKECADARWLFAEPKGSLPLLVVEKVGSIDVAEQGEREGVATPSQAQGDARGGLSSNHSRYFG